MSVKVAFFIPFLVPLVWKNSKKWSHGDKTSWCTKVMTWQHSYWKFFKSTKLKRNLIHNINCIRFCIYQTFLCYRHVHCLVSCQKLQNSTNLQKDYKATSLAAEIHLPHDDEICHHVITFLSQSYEWNQQCIKWHENKDILADVERPGFKLESWE